MRNGTASASGRRWGGFKTRLQRQDVRAAWPARQKAGDEWQTRGVKPLSWSATATDCFLKKKCDSVITDDD